MGYCMSMNDSKFFVSTENVGRVMAVARHYPYEFEFDEDGNITDIDFVGDKLAGDKAMFQKIAPFVRDDSFIEMEGEDGACWKWVFKNGKCKEVRARLVWEE